jgi:hypothetical protein
LVFERVERGLEKAVRIDIARQPGLILAMNVAGTNEESLARHECEREQPVQTSRRCFADHDDRLESVAIVAIPGPDERRCLEGRPPRAREVELPPGPVEGVVAEPRLECRSAEYLNPQRSASHA